MSRAGQDATLPITVFDPHSLAPDGGCLLAARTHRCGSSTASPRAQGCWSPRTSPLADRRPNEPLWPGSGGPRSAWPEERVAHEESEHEPSWAFALPVSLPPELRVTTAQTDHMPLYLRTFIRVLSSWVHRPGASSNPDFCADLSIRRLAVRLTATDPGMMRRWR